MCVVACAHRSGDLFTAAKWTPGPPRFSRRTAIRPIELVFRPSVYSASNRMPALGRPLSRRDPAAVMIAYHALSAPAPLRLIFLATTDRGLRYAEFMDRRSIKRIIAGHEAENPGATWEASLLRLKPVVDEFEQYFCGTVMRFDVPLDPVGSEFQLECWKALSAIPFGETRTYGEIARAIGQPKAARAVGLANHDNPIVIIVPCHRVVGADGSLTGYGGGLPRKRWLLRHEARFAAPLFTPERPLPSKSASPPAASTRQS